METVINVTLPIFAIISLGYLAGYWKILGDGSADALNRYVFLFALPPAMFFFTSRAEVSQVLNFNFMATYCLGMILTAGLAVLVASTFFGAAKERSAFHGFLSIFANAGYMGIPLFLTAFGPDGVVPAIIASLVGGIGSMIFIMTALEFFRAGSGSVVHLLLGIWRVVSRNPLFIATGLGILFSALAIPVPKSAENLLEMLAGTAGPTALFALGLSLVHSKILGDMLEVTWIVFLKLIVQPVFTWLIATQLFTTGPFWTASVILLAAMPVGSTAFVIAQQYGVAAKISSASVALSTIGSVITLTLLMIYFGIS
ncbi:MAG: AEC family transporter [Hyphomicrobiales bacterium]